jgi:hypothetical protein
MMDYDIHLQCKRSGEESSTLKMETAGFPEMLTFTYQNTYVTSQTTVS